MKRLSVTLALVVAVACSSSLFAQVPTVSIVSPKAGTLAGAVAMEAKLDGALPAGGGVRFLLDDKPLCGPILQAPFTFNWHTSHVWDTDAVLHAVVVDGKGEEVAKSEPVAMRIDNGFGGRVTLSGVDLSKPLTGIVKLNLHAECNVTDADREANKANGQPPDKAIESIMVFIDGVQHTHRFGTADLVVELDTTQLPNGPHELFVQVAAFKKGTPTCAMLRRTFFTENEMPPASGFRPQYSRIFLAPGESVNLKPIAGDLRAEIALSITVGPGQPADPAVATVKDGVVTAVAPGVTSVVVKAPFADGTSEKTVSIIVDKPHGFPHFGKDGSLLTEYDPKNSLWVRSMFSLGGFELERMPGLPAAVRAAGINVLSEGFYHNPADSGAKDFDSWHKGWRAHWERNLAWSKTYDMPMMLIGDDIARTANELNGSVNLEWGPKAVRTAFEAAAESKRAVCVEMIDEVSFCWGDTPAPTDGRWKNRTPPLADDAFIKLLETINSVKGRPGITWPIGGISGPECAKAWMGDPRFSDYATLYWDILAWRRAYEYGGSHAQELDALRRCVDDRLYGLQRNRPMLLLVSGCGPFYHKRGEGTQYVPGQDFSIGMPAQPATPTNGTMVMYASAAGMAGVRVYSFDYKGWKDERTMQKPGSGAELQTGADPFEVGTDRWLSLASAFRLIENLEPFMLLPQTHAPYLGEGIFTGARKGKNGEMVIAINFTNGARTIDRLPLPSNSASAPLPLEANTGRRPSSVVYRVHGMTLRAEPYESGKPLTLQPGEAAVRVRPLQDGEPVRRRGGATCAFAAPLADAHVRGKVAILVNSNVSGEGAKMEIFAGGTALDVKKTDRGYEAVWDASNAKPNVWHGLTAIATTAGGTKTEARTAVFVRE